MVLYLALVQVLVVGTHRPYSRHRIWRMLFLYVEKVSSIIVEPDLFIRFARSDLLTQAFRPSFLAFYIYLFVHYLINFVCSN